MAKLSADAPAIISSWAVAKMLETSQVAIKFDDLQPVLMSVEGAREFAAAINAELGEVAPRMEPLIRLA